MDMPRQRKRRSLFERTCLVSVVFAIVLVVGGVRGQDPEPRAGASLRLAERSAAWRDCVIHTLKAPRPSDPPCVITSDGTMLAIVYAGESGGELGVAWSGDAGSHWSHKALRNRPVRAVGIATSRAASIALVHCDTDDGYRFAWTTSSRRNLRWETHHCLPQVISDSFCPVVCVARYRDEICAAHIDPETRCLESVLLPKGRSAVAVPLRESEVVVALTISPAGWIHGLTRHGSAVYHVTNVGGRVLRNSVSSTADANTTAALEIGDDETAHMILRASAKAGLQYCRAKGDTVRIEAVDGSDTVQRACAIRLDAAGSVQALYVVGSALRWIRRDEDAWTGVDVVSEANTLGGDLALDGDGFAHLCYATDGGRSIVYATNRK